MYPSHQSLFQFQYRCVPIVVTISKKISQGGSSDVSYIAKRRIWMSQVFIDLFTSSERRGERDQRVAQLVDQIYMRDRRRRRWRRRVMKKEEENHFTAFLSCFPFYWELDGNIGRDPMTRELYRTRLDLQFRARSQPVIIGQPPVRLLYVFHYRKMAESDGGLLRTSCMAKYREDVKIRFLIPAH